MKKHILLIGMPGSGKSTVGKQLADELGHMFIDTDKLIEEQFNLPLPKVVEKLSAEAFLTKEAKVIKSVLGNKSPSVISPGGSIAYYQNLLPEIKNTSHCFLLHVPIDILKSRIDDNPRGIVKIKNSFQELYFERLPLYRRLTEYELDGTQPVDALVNDIIKLYSTQKTSNF